MAGKQNSSPNQLKNLQVFGKIPPEVQRERSRKGAAASNAVQKRKRTLRQSLEWLLNEPMFDTDNDAVNAIKEKFPDMTNGDAMNVALIAKAVSEGDAKAYTSLRDTAGEMPSLFGGLDSEPITIRIETVE